LAICVRWLEKYPIQRGGRRNARKTILGVTISGNIKVLACDKIISFSWCFKIICHTLFKPPKEVIRCQQHWVDTIVRFEDGALREENQENQKTNKLKLLRLYFRLQQDLAES
jgi:hypothetical protein